MCEQLKKKTLKSITFPDFLVYESRLINREGLGSFSRENKKDVTFTPGPESRSDT